MEWGKVKSILIVLFLMLNAVLAANIVNQYLDRRVGDDFREDIDQIIEKRGITLECELPVEKYEVRRLIYEDNSDMARELATRLAGEDLIGVKFTGPESFTYTSGAQQDELGFEHADNSPLDEPGSVREGGALQVGFDIEDDENLDATARAMFWQAGIDMSEFIIDKILYDISGGKIIKYIRKYEGELIFDSNIKVFFNPAGDIYSIHVNSRGVRGFSEEVKMQMIPAYQVVLRNAFQEGQVIRAIDVGYLGQEGEQDGAFTESMEGAVWRIKLDDGNDRYFEGVYGNEIIYVV
ncbi:MAG: hypothetical protein FWH55_12080 [Oscillospiraceae bacterium]|nr:hypothetical protein [Oscillospiraceae bacterium]